jgi:hypothetical protein
MGSFSLGAIVSLLCAVFSEYLYFFAVVWFPFFLVTARRGFLSQFATVTHVFGKISILEFATGLVGGIQNFCFPAFNPKIASTVATHFVL